MTPLERAAILRAQQRVSRFQPDMTSRILRAWQIIRESLTEAEVARLMESGTVDLLIDDVLTEPDLDRALLAFRQQIRQTVVDSYALSTRDLPKAGKIEGVPAVAFDHLSPRVIEAIRTLESKALNTLKGDVKEITRAYVENGIRDGTSPASVARQLRSVIGMAPNQADAVQNFERMLRSGDKEALTRQLRDRRFDGTLERVFADGKSLSDSQIAMMAEAYKRKMIAYNANLNATTHTRDAYKLGQKLSWQDAAENGVIPAGFQAVKTWVHFDPQPNPRPEHVAMNGETVPADKNYSNGDSYAGEGDPWNCFVGVTEVEGAFVLGLKALYTGPLREIVTARGYRLTVTPNHPVLTDCGWVAAGKLHEGSRLFSKRVDVNIPTLVGVDHQQEPTAIQDVFNALSPERPIPPGVTLNLHGDARFLVGDVHVVTADRELALERRQGFDDGVDDWRLSDSAPNGAAVVDGSCAPAPLGFGPLAATHSTPRLAEQSSGRLPITTDILPPQALSVGPAADWDAPLPDVFLDSSTTVTAFVRELIQASSGLVAADQIVSVRDYRAVEVHVYDLQSINGWLLASNIVCSNCHCTDRFSIARIAP